MGGGGGCSFKTLGGTLGGTFLPPLAGSCTGGAFLGISCFLPAVAVEGRARFLAAEGECLSYVVGYSRWVGCWQGVGWMPFSQAWAQAGRAGLRPRNSRWEPLLLLHNPREGPLRPLVCCPWPVWPGWLEVRPGPPRTGLPVSGKMDATKVPFHLVAVVLATNQVTLSGSWFVACKIKFL